MKPQAEGNGDYDGGLTPAQRDLTVASTPDVISALVQRLRAAEAVVEAARAFEYADRHSGRGRALVAALRAHDEAAR